eukprot:3198094-Amphidinium_carterae.1
MESWSAVSFQDLSITVCSDWGDVAAEGSTVNDIEVAGATDWSTVSCGELHVGSPVSAPACREEVELELSSGVSAHTMQPRRRGRPPKNKTVIPTSSIAGGTRPPTSSMSSSSVALSTDVLLVQSSCPMPSKLALQVPKTESSVSALDNYGFNPMPLSAKALMAAADAAAIAPHEIDTDYVRLAAMFLGEHGQGAHVTSVAVQAEQLGMSRLSLQEKLHRLLCCHFLHSRVTQGLLEQRVSSCSRYGFLALAYVDYMTYHPTVLDYRP